MRISSLVTCLVCISICIISNSVLLVTGAASDCVWDVDDGTLDLSSLSSTKLDYTVVTTTSTTFDYAYTPCRDDLTCTNGDDGDVGVGSYMATQTGGQCNYLAIFNATVTPKKSGSSYTLTYRNGAPVSNVNRVFVAKFSCGSSSATVTGVAETTESSSGAQVYTMSITSEYACFGSSGSSDELSVGWIIIIIFIACIFLYCLVGYVICAKKNPDNGWTNVKANTPHLSFWCAVPKWTWAGCCVTKEFIVNGVNKIRNKGDESGYDSIDDA